MGIGIGKLSRATGCNIETIRYYERIGMVDDPGRSSGGHRVYGAEHIARLRFIRRARELGFGLEDIRELLVLSPSMESACDDAQHIASTHLGSVRQKIADLRKLETVLSGLLSRCDPHKGACPVLQALSEDP